jgi:hypothetical protein
MVRSRRELERLGRVYREAHNGFLPDRVRRSGKKSRRKAREALGDGVGVLARLAMLGPDLVHVTIHLDALGLGDLEHESNLYTHDAVNRIKARTLELFTGSFWARLEVGREARRLHVHGLMHESPSMVHHAEPVTDLGRIAEYLSKCQVPADDFSTGIFLEARAEAFKAGKPRLPKTSWFRGIPSGRAALRVIEPK